MKPLDITGKRFGKLVAIERAHKTLCGKWKWLCRCDCGNYKEIDIHSLLRKDRPSTVSCGMCKKSMKGTKCYKHGMTHTNIYQRYKLMKNRCYNPHNKRYYLYGGRGIKMCDEWLGEDGSKNFIEWALNNGYREDLTLDRINGDEGYSPNNCRWVTRKEQSNNLRTNVLYDYNGCKYTLSQIADIVNMDQKLLRSRIRLGWDLDKAINTPKRSR